MRYRLYIDAALKRAQCTMIDDDTVYYCAIPDLPGVWATGDTEECARIELIEVIEDWIELGLQRGHNIPILDGINLNADQPQHAPPA